MISFIFFKTYMILIRFYVIKYEEPIKFNNKKAATNTRRDECISRYNKRTFHSLKSCLKRDEKKIQELKIIKKKANNDVGYIDFSVSADVPVYNDPRIVRRRIYEMIIKLVHTTFLWLFHICVRTCTRSENAHVCAHAFPSLKRIQENAFFPLTLKSARFAPFLSFGRISDAHPYKFDRNKKKMHVCWEKCTCVPLVWEFQLFFGVFRFQRNER